MQQMAGQAPAEMKPALELILKQGRGAPARPLEREEVMAP